MAIVTLQGQLWGLYCTQEVASDCHSLSLEPQLLYLHVQLSTY